MLALHRTIRWAAGAGSFLLLAASLITAADPLNRLPGQPAGNPGPQAEPRRVIANKPVAETMTPAQRRDQHIARWLLQSNQNEIALAHFAAAKTENKQVRQFAEMLEKDHSQGLGNLERFAGRMTDTTAVAPAAGNPTPRAGVEVVAPFVEVNVGDNPQAGAPQLPDEHDGLNPGAIHRQIGERYLNMVEQEWAHKKPYERDMAFVGTQMVMHQYLIATEEVLRQYASPELQSVIDDGLKEARGHLGSAKSLIEELAHQDHASK